MSFLLPLLLFVIFVACVGILFREGMWGNGIRLINVVTAALLATNFFEPAARWLEGPSGSDGWFRTCTYLWDFLAIWGLFALWMGLFTLATNAVSRVKVRFLKIVDIIGGVFFSAWIGWVMVCFTMMTLHTAPLAQKFMGGAFDAEQRMILGLAPDRLWLGFMQRMSLGTFCRSASESDVAQVTKKVATKPWAAQWQADETRTFDPRSEFMPKYATRRAKLEEYNNQYGKLRVSPKHLAK